MPEHNQDVLPESSKGERHYRLVMLVTVTDDVKAWNQRGGMGDREYISAEVGWIDSSFGGMEDVSLTEVPMPSGDMLHRSPLEVLHHLEHGDDGQPGTGWSDFCKLHIMQDYIRQVDPEGFVMFALGLAAKERAQG